MKMKRVLALMLSSAMICTAVPGQVFAAEETLEVVNEFSDESDENDSVEVEDQELEESDIDEDTSNTDEEISEIDLQEGENSQQDLDIESGNNEDELFSDGENDAVFVKSGDVSDDIKWELDDSDDDGLEDTLIISGNGDMPDYTSYEEAPWYAYRKTISHLIIKDGITSIGSYSFLFENLENIEWGDNITRIGNHTLDDCKKMTELNLPSNLVSIGSCTFGGWTALTSVEIPNNVKTMGNEAFQECENLVSVKFSNKIEEIGNAVFLNCKKVKTVFLPTSIKKIGRSFFYGRKKFDYYQSYSGCLLSTIHYAGTKEDMLKIDGINEEELRQDGPVPLKVYFHYIVYHAPKNATCSKKGFVGYWICNNCGGKIYADAECTQELSEIPSSPALGHELNNGVVNKEASCAEEGSILYTCQREGCDYTETRAIPRTQNHIYGKTSYVWSSNSKKCTAKRYCIICDEEESETVETQETVTKSATCTENGILQYVAVFTKECFETQQKKKNIAPLNHQNTEIKNKKRATCNEKGYTGDIYCKDCGLLLSKGDIISKIGHIWNTGTKIKEPTCTENGELVYACKICGKIRTEKVKATGHKEVKDAAVAATCEKAGKSEGSRCSVCGKVIKAQKEVPALGHNWAAGKITKAATCTETGVKTYTCTRCKKTKTEEIKATGHKEVKDAAVSATCEKAGKTEGSHCSVCGKVIKAQKKVPALGHSWDTGKVTKEATCTEAGVKTYTCTRCKKTKTEEIPKINHKEVKDAEIKATCEKAGKTEGSHCSVCGNIIKKQENIPTLQHKWNDEYTIEKDATCIEDGKKEYRCTVCGKNKTEKIPAIGHKWNSTYTVEKKETCTKTGEKDIRCSVCNAIKEKSVKKIPAKGHSFTVKKTISQATVLAAAKKEYECSACGFKEIRSVGNKLKATMKVSTSKIAMKPQQKITSLKVTYAKGDSVTSWKIANTKLVKVTGKANGTCVLTAGKLGGTTTLTIKLKSGLIKKVSITVNVKTQQITGVSSKLTLVKGQYITIKPKLYPATSTDKITYKSNNSVVSVNSNGEIHARKKGTAVVTVKSGNKSVKIQITVEDPKLSKTSLSLDVKQTYQLKISGTSQKVKWSSDNNSIASVSSTGKVTAKKQGKTTIRACVGNSKFSCKVSIKKAILTPKLEAILSSKTKTSTSVIVMSVKNNGDRTLRINSNAALLDRDYDKFDRDLRLIDEDTIMPISYLDIAPGKSKFVVFEVIGNRTWYDKKSTIVYQFKYRNKTYKIASSSYYGTYFIK